LQEATDIKHKEKEDFTTFSDAKIYFSFFTFKRRENAWGTERLPATLRLNKENFIAETIIMIESSISSWKKWPLMGFTHSDLFKLNEVICSES